MFQNKEPFNPIRSLKKFFLSWVEDISNQWARHNRVKEYRELGARRLEIGAAGHRIDGFETLDVSNHRETDYVWDAAKALPFKDQTFDVIYSSHTLEHIPWYQCEDVVFDWVSKLKLGGRLELWVPDGLKICKAFVDAEVNGNNYIDRDGWYKFNENRDPCLWASGRIFTYGDGKGAVDDPNWHRAIFSERYLKQVMVKAGLIKVRRLDSSEVRGFDHGWINLGMVGEKC